MKKIIFPILIIFLASCNPWKYVGEYDHKADFSKFKTFGLLNWERSNDEQVDPETKEYILMAIKSELESRGYVYQKKDADLQVSIFIIINEETSYSAYSDHIAGYTGYGGIAVGVGVGTGGVGVAAAGYGVNMYPYTVVQHDYNVGAFVVDILDHSTKKQVWQGLAEGRLTHEDANEGAIRDRVGRIFGLFPVKKVRK
jgi:hypothetical protein